MLKVPNHPALRHDGGRERLDELVRRRLTPDDAELGKKVITHDEILVGAYIVE